MSVNNPYRSSDEAAAPGLCVPSAHSKKSHSIFNYCPTSMFSMRIVLILLLLSMAIISYVFHVYHARHSNPADSLMGNKGRTFPRLRGEHLHSLRKPDENLNIDKLANNLVEGNVEKQEFSAFGGDSEKGTPTDSAKLATKQEDKILAVDSKPEINVPETPIADRGVRKNKRDTWDSANSRKRIENNSPVAKNAFPVANASAEIQLESKPQAGDSKDTMDAPVIMNKEVVLPNVFSMNATGEGSRPNHNLPPPIVSANDAAIPDIPVNHNVPPIIPALQNNAIKLADKPSNRSESKPLQNLFDGHSTHTHEDGVELPVPEVQPHDPNDIFHLKPVQPKQEMKQPKLEAMKTVTISAIKPVLLVPELPHAVINASKPAGPGLLLDRKVLNSVILETAAKEHARNDSIEVNTVRRDRMAFDLPKPISRPTVSVALAATAQEVVVTPDTAFFDFCGVVPPGKQVIVTATIPVDQFVPKPGSSSKDQERRWQSAVMNMKARLQRVKVGGVQLREMLQKEVLSLKDQRSQIFCAP